MFTRWLLNTLPGELAAGWRIVRADLGLWLVMAMLPGLMTAASVRAVDGPSARLGLVTILALVLLSMLAIVKFDAAAHGRRLPLDDALGRIPGRILPYLAAFASVAVITLGAGWLAEEGVLIATRGTPVSTFAAAAVSTVIYLTLLVRYAFWPYLAVLDRRPDLDQRALAGGKWLAPLAVVGWPLMASSAMTAGHGWRLAPYVVLMGLGPSLTAAAPLTLRPPLAALWWIVQLTLQAVIFNHYRERLGVVGVEQEKAGENQTPASPSSS
ncbi:MAG: hypothetical protein V3R77_02885 [Candidatus Binatia bacterium]